MDPVKLWGIADWPLPKTVKDIQSFLGFRNYYRKFIDGYGDLTTLLNKLLRKDKKFEWTSPWQLAFNTLKVRFLEAPVLQMPDPLKPFVVRSDTSKFASGAVLQQQDTNGDWHPCSYLSQSFNAMEQNYKIYDRKLLAIIWALTEWRHYLLGSPHPVTVLSDHKNLTVRATCKVRGDRL